MDCPDHRQRVLPRTVKKRGIRHKAGSPGRKKQKAGHLYRGCAVQSDALQAEHPSEEVHTVIEAAKKHTVHFYGDMSANSGNNALSRDPDFSRGFITRHQSKLIFGSDCSCPDGHGAGISQGNNPEAARLAGKCVARETLTVLKSLTSPEIFRRITFDNDVKPFKIPV
jgi:hypothetical protein